ncbi:MAG: hypothetical protein AAF270_12315 [Pseudomonadota bacterium]
MFVDFLATANTVFYNFMTLIFAMFTASYFRAGKLTRSMCVLFLAFYSLWSLFMLLGVVSAFADFAGLGIAFFFIVRSQRNPIGNNV